MREPWAGTPSGVSYIKAHTDVKVTNLPLSFSYSLSFFSMTGHSLGHSALWIGTFWHYILIKWSDY